jgi:hypothetical protein
MGWFPGNSNTGSYSCPVLAALSAIAKRYNCPVIVDRTISHNKIVVKIGQAATGED